MTGAHRELFQWDFGEDLSEKRVFEHRSEEEKKRTRQYIPGQSLLMREEIEVHSQ